VSLAEAADIAAESRGLPVLGVFGDQPVEEIVRRCREAGLAGAQLHGRYGAEDAARLAEVGLIVWRVLRIARPEELDLLHETSHHAETVLIEPGVSGAEGGAGVPLDLALALEARRRLPDSRMALAGGLTPETVGRAVALVRPDVVDVSSGVESHPGIKDHEKIARFLEAVLGRSPTVG
jgi:phosphoribosylanthranilate isomerase